MYTHFWSNGFYTYIDTRRLLISFSALSRFTEEETRHWLRVSSRPLLSAFSYLNQLTGQILLSDSAHVTTRRCDTTGSNWFFARGVNSRRFPRVSYRCLPRWTGTSSSERTVAVRVERRFPVSGVGTRSNRGSSGQWRRPGWCYDYPMVLRFLRWSYEIRLRAVCARLYRMRGRIDRSVRDTVWDREILFITTAGRLFIYDSRVDRDARAGGIYFTKR